MATIKDSLVIADQLPSGNGYTWTLASWLGEIILDELLILSKAVTSFDEVILTFLFSNCFDFVDILSIIKYFPTIPEQ